jgi:arsenate reductase (glutaredoxin)
MPKLPKIRVYQYDNCATCKKALKFLDQKGVAYEKLPIVDQPPSESELKAMLKSVGELKKLFNTSGQLYREMGMSEKLKAMSESEALKLLSKHGKLVKRPFALAGTRGLVGFNESEWKKLV